jgi:hypothetical protein
MSGKRDSRCDAIQAVWIQVRESFELLSAVTSERPQVINALTHELAEMFASSFGQREVAERFMIPDDYRCFLTLSQGCRRRGDAYGLYLHDVDIILSNTRFYFELYAADRPSTSGMWIEIGHYSDRHDLFLCCDRHLPQFGMVVDGHDDAPWNPEGEMHRNVMAGYTGVWTSKSFLDYLQSLVYKSAPHQNQEH